MKLYPAQAEIVPAIATGEGVDFSIVIPMFNEEENIERLYAEIKSVLDNMERTSEIILIDDGSTDRTFDILKSIHASDRRVRVVRLRRNFGQSAGFSAGFDLARGEVVITMDGDLQNDPADIHRLLDKIDEGFDVVSGWRVDRQDVYLTRKLPSRYRQWVDLAGDPCQAPRLWLLANRFSSRPRVWLKAWISCPISSSGGP